MLKWLFIILIMFFGIWFFFKNDFPESIRNSQSADLINAVIYPVEKHIMHYRPGHKKHRHANDIQEMSSDQILKTFKSLESKGGQTIFLFYEPGCFNCVISLNVVNKLAESYRDVYFVVIGVSEDKDEILSFLDIFGKINFAPLLVAESEFGLVKSWIYNRDIIFKELPVAFYKGQSGKYYKEISPGLFMKSRIEKLIQEKL